METIEKLDGKTLNLVKENISALKSLFPEAFSEEKIDFDKLRLLLGDEVETSSEKYSFNWHGKSEAIKLALKQSSGTLKPCVKDSKNWDTTKNLYIEGDNLEVLKILQGAYQNKVKMIYIDPPYNTGKDFVYKDSFKDNIKHYKEQVQETGKANPETAGRYHTNWLNMMYPRLKLARNLLKDDGVIFISIDDHEVHNLRKICDEIFGEENFISSITVVNNIAGRSDRKHIATAHEFILIFQKSNLFESTGLMLSESQLQEYKFRDSKGKLYRKQGLRKRGSGARRIDRPNMFYPIYVNPETMQLSLEKSEFKNSVEILPKLSNGNDGRWRWGKTTFEEKKYLLLVSKNTKRGEFDLFEKVDFETENGQKTTKMKSFLLDSEYTTDIATTEISEVIEPKIFDSPKPIQLLKDFFHIVNDHNSIILDFFSGSATTAHAVMKLNAEDGGNRRYIMVQLPEKTPEDHEARKAGYETIAEIGKERIRRAGEKIKEEFKDKEGIENLDIGFKVFKLNESNFTAWNTNTSDLTQTLSEMKNTIMGSSSSEDAFYEVLLKLGIDISLPVEEIEIKGKKIYSLAGHYILACFDKNLSLDIIEEMARLSSETETIVVSDDVFKDNLTKLNAEETLKRNHVKFLRVV